MSFIRSIALVVTVSLLFQACRPDAEPEQTLSLTDAANARLKRVSYRETGSFGKEFEQRLRTELSNYRRSSYASEYDSRGVVIASYYQDYDKPDDTTNRTVYRRSGSQIIYQPNRFVSYVDTLQVNAMGYVLKNAFDRKRIDLYPGGQYEYDQDGYLTKEISELYRGRITLEHTYAGGDRIGTTVTYYQYGVETERAIVNYEYDQSAYNPNLPNDVPNVFGDQGLGGTMFAQYAKYHFSLYGKLNRHLLMRVRVTKPDDPKYQRDHAYTYTFDAKKRPTSVEVVMQNNYGFMAISQRLFTYMD